MSGPKIAKEPPVVPGSQHPLHDCTASQLDGVRRVMESLAIRNVGTVMQFIETLGLEDKQERAFKGLIKNNLYHVLDDELSCLRFLCPGSYEEYSKSAQSLPPLSVGS